MRWYRTEIHVPADRHIQLQLPEDIPEGRAFVTVEVVEQPVEPDTSDDLELDLDHQDIEWWDEFEADDPTPQRQGS